VQTAKGFDHIETRAQPEVEGVAQNDLRADVVQIARRHGFDGAVSADRHKNGGFDDAVFQRQRAATRSAAGGFEFKIHVFSKPTGSTVRRGLHLNGLRQQTQVGASIH